MGLGNPTRGMEDTEYRTSLWAKQSVRLISANILVRSFAGVLMGIGRLISP